MCVVPAKAQGCPGKLEISQLVVPAKAGTHTALPQNEPLLHAHVTGGMGPRFRGDDKESLSLDAGEEMLDAGKSAA